LDGSDTDGDVDEVVSIVVLAWVWVEELAVLWDPEPDDEGVISAKTFSIGKLKYNSAIIESVSAFSHRFILVSFSPIPMIH